MLAALAATFALALAVALGTLLRLLLPCVGELGVCRANEWLPLLLLLLAPLSVVDCGAPKSTAPLETALPTAKPAFDSPADCDDVSIGACPACAAGAAGAADNDAADAVESFAAPAALAAAAALDFSSFCKSGHAQKLEHSH